MYVAIIINKAELDLKWQYRTHPFNHSCPDCEYSSQGGHTPWGAADWVFLASHTKLSPFWLSDHKMLALVFTCSVKAKYCVLCCL